MNDAEPMRLDAFAADTKLDAAAFRQRHGDAFFVFLGHSGDLQPAARLGQTVRLETEPNSGQPMQKAFLVFPVRRSGRSPFPNFISIGRADKNDVVINDESLSKFHAYVRDEDGRFSLLDAGSRNGTFVNDEAVPTKEKGDPILLEAGMSVRFGSVACSFLGASELLTLVRTLAS